MVDTFYALLVAAVVVLLCGFVFPWFAGRKETLKKAKEYHEKEQRQWNFRSEDRDGPWLNCMEGPLIVKSGFSSRKSFYSEWLVIHRGYVFVNPGMAAPNKESKTVSYDFDYRRTYAWDGCTPKLWFFWIILVGTPDWHRKPLKVMKFGRDENTETVKPRIDTVVWPLAHRASVVHDALYQYLSSIPVKKVEVDQLFKRMLRRDGMNFIVAQLYYFGVRLLGGRGVEQKNIDKDPLFECKDFDLIVDQLRKMKSSDITAASS